MQNQEDDLISYSRRKFWAFAFKSEFFCPLFSSTVYLYFNSAHQISRSENAETVAEPAFTVRDAKHLVTSLDCAFLFYPEFFVSVFSALSPEVISYVHLSVYNLPLQIGVHCTEQYS